MIRRRLPANVEMDDLVQSGLIGLNEALSRFEKGFGLSFKTYAARRIEGAMLDALRASDTLPRSVRSRLRDIGEAVQRLQHRLGRTPRAVEVANELGWSLNLIHKCMVEANAGGTRAGDEELEQLEAPSCTGEAATGVHADPFRAMEQRQRHAALNAAFDALDEADRYVMEMIYDRDLTLREVGRTLGVSQSRVSQICTRIVAKLKHRLREH